MAFAVLSGCTLQSQPSATAASLCQSAATDNAVLLARIAQQHSVSPQVIDEEFIAACTSRVTSDIQETAADLGGIIDAGVSQ